MGLQQFNEVSPQSDSHEFLVAEVSNVVSVFANTDTAHRVDRVWAINKEAYQILAWVWLDTADGQLPIGSVQIPASIGVGGSKPYDLLVNVIPSGDTGIPLLAGQQLYIQYITPLTFDGNLLITSLGGKL